MKTLTVSQRDIETLERRIEELNELVKDINDRIGRLQTESHIEDTIKKVKKLIKRTNP